MFKSVIVTFIAEWSLLPILPMLMGMPSSHSFFQSRGTISRYTLSSSP